MTRRERQIVAMGGGGFSMEPDNTLLDDYVIGLTGVAKPRLCFVPTASGDADGYIDKFYQTFPPERCQASHRLLFHPRKLDRYPDFGAETGEMRSHLLAQDAIYVGGGSTPNMLAVWRVHGVDQVLRQAWVGGAVLCGLSAGSLCWFEAGTTDAFGRRLEPLLDGLGFLPGSHSPHYDGEPERRPKYQEWIAAGTLPAGYAADDGVGLHFVGRKLVEAVSSRPEAKAYRVRRVGSRAVETRLTTRFLGG